MTQLGLSSSPVGKTRTPLQEVHLTRPNRDREVPLDRFFHPRTVAVIGASPRQDSPTRLLYRTVRKSVEAAGGIVHAINPRYDEIDGRPCYHSIEDVPGPLDLVVIAAGDPVTTLEAALQRRPLFVMMFSAGFAESGADGAHIQEKLQELIAGSDSYLLGPNTTLNSFLPLDPELTGPKIALISHSGHQGRHLWEGQKLGIPLYAWAPTGNEVDLEFADFARYFADQPDIGAVAAYIEGFKHGQTFVSAAEYAADRRTPLVIAKVGRTEHGRSTALSHTAHLAGSDEVCSGVFRQHGVVRVDTLDELLHTAAFLARAAPPAAPGVCVYTISGGTSAHLTDLLVSTGIQVPELTAETQQSLSQWIPSYLRVSNPVDSGGAPSGDWRGRHILETLVADPRIGVLVVPFVADAYHLSAAITQDVIEVSKQTDKPICVVWGSPISSSATYADVLVKSGLPVFRTFKQCMSALSGYFEYHAFLAGRDADSSTPASGPVDGTSRRADLSSYPGGLLSEWDSKRLISRHGVPVSRDERATTAAAAVAAADRIGYPVAVKINSAAIAHKTELGLVCIGLRDADDVAAAFEAIISAARDKLPGTPIDGVIVSKMVSGLHEMVVGVSRDDVFGPAVMVGFGGAMIEVVPDVSFRVPPFTRAEGRRMIEQLRGYRLLLPQRGRPGADVEALVDVVMRVHDLALAAGDFLEEIDLNPVIVSEHGATTVDAMVVLK
jgi:acyl-CoA synthetase (NDP forming)